MYCNIFIIKYQNCWKTKNSIRAIKQQLLENTEYYISEIQQNKEKYKSSEIIKKLNENVQTFSKEYYISIYNENIESTNLYFTFYSKISEENLVLKNFSVFNLSNQIIEDEDEIEELDEMLIPNIDDKKIARIVDEFYKNEGEEKDVKLINNIE